MGTRIEGVMIPVELDTDKAQKQLDKLESDLTKGKKKADDLNKVLNKPGLSGGGKTGTTGVSGGPEVKTARPGSPSFLQPQMPGLGSTPVSGVLGKVGSAAAKVDSTGAIAEGAAGAAAIYGAARTVAMNAPLALEAGRAAVGLSTNDPALKMVQDQLIALQNSFNYIESYVKSAITGLGKTYDMATAQARVNGKMPNILTLYSTYKEADMQEDMLKKKFDYFKDQEVAAAVGLSMGEYFRDGMNR